MAGMNGAPRYQQDHQAVRHRLLAAEHIIVVGETRQQLQVQLQQAAIEVLRLLLPTTQGVELRLPQVQLPELTLQQADLRHRIQEVKHKLREINLKVQEAKLYQTATPIQDRNTTVRTEHIRQVTVIRE